MHYVAEAAYLEAGADGENDVAIVVDVEAFLHIAALAFIDGDAAAEGHNELFLYFIALAGDDGDAGIFFEALNYIANGAGCYKVGEHGVECCGEAELEGGNEEDDDVETENDLGYGEAAALEGVEGEDLDAIYGAAAAHGKANADAEEEAAEDGDKELIGSDDGVGDDGEADAEADDACQHFEGKGAIDMKAAGNDKGNIEQEDDEGDIEVIELVNEEGYPHDAAIEKVVGYEEAFECKCADEGAQ